ncbi:unnamed protein product [Closterium sp. Yama58-4]|nr:unnamed protein product [Closterium sp. Yama58-4]
MWHTMKPYCAPLLPQCPHCPPNAHCVTTCCSLSFSPATHCIDISPRPSCNGNHLDNSLACVSAGTIAHAYASMHTTAHACAGVLFSSRTHPRTSHLSAEQAWHASQKQGVVLFALPGERYICALKDDFCITFHDSYGDFSCWLHTSFTQSHHMLKTTDLDGFDKRRLASPGFVVELLLMPEADLPPPRAHSTPGTPHSTAQSTQPSPQPGTQRSAQQQRAEHHAAGSEQSGEQREGERGRESRSTDGGANLDHGIKGASGEGALVEGGQRGLKEGGAAEGGEGDGGGSRGADGRIAGDSSVGSGSLGQMEEQQGEGGKGGKAAGDGALEGDRKNGGLVVGDGSRSVDGSRSTAAAAPKVLDATAGSRCSKEGSEIAAAGGSMVGSGGEREAGGGGSGEASQGDGTEVKCRDAPGVSEHSNAAPVAATGSAGPMGDGSGVGVGTEKGSSSSGGDESLSITMKLDFMKDDDDDDDRDAGDEEQVEHDEEGAGQGRNKRQQVPAFSAASPRSIAPRSSFKDAFSYLEEHSSASSSSAAAAKPPLAPSSTTDPSNPTATPPRATPSLLSATSVPSPAALDAKGSSPASKSAAAGAAGAVRVVGNDSIDALPTFEAAAPAAEVSKSEEFFFGPSSDFALAAASAADASLFTFGDDEEE